MTAVDERIDLSWVTFTDDPDDECDGFLDDDDCPSEPVAVAVWKAWCDCAAGETRHCARHRDQLAALVAAGEPLECQECHSRVLLLRLEPLR
jgi:hypothetical protein